MGKVYYEQMSIRIRKRSAYDYNTLTRRNAILRGQC